MPEFKIIGRRMPLIDAEEKVTGAAIFGADVVLPRMLHGKILRSPHAHARIVDIDTSKAERVPGVRTVATGRNTPDAKFGILVQDERFFAKDEVHYLGDEVAAVAAIDEETAAEALRLIEVEYEELPSVFDPVEAMLPDAPLVHHDTSSNVCHHVELSRGDVQRGFDDAAVVHEETYRLPYQYQAYIEPNVATATWEGGRLTIWAPIQTPRVYATMICRAFGIPRGAFRFIQTYIGGGFGGKAYQRVGPIAAVLAKMAGSPVRVVYARGEDFQTTLPRVPMVIKLRMGVNEEGIVTAKDMCIVADNGAYTAMGHAILDTAATRVDSLYRFKNLNVVADLVYTNKVPTGMFRGFGNPQAHFAVESMMDTLAVKLGMDPMKLRLRNATQTGDVTAHGWVIGSCGLSQTIEKAAREIRWSAKRDRMKDQARGIGMACGLHVSGNRVIAPEGDGSAAQVRVHEDGTVHVATSEGGIGQGAKTIFAQLAAEELGVPYERVFVDQLDTDVTYFGIGAGASRVTVLGGNAVRAGAAAARARLIEAAAHKWDCDRGEVELIAGKLVNTRAETTMEIGEAAAHYIGMTGGSRLMGEGFFRAEGVVVPDRKTKYGNISLAYAFATHVAEVEVDVETGVVTVLQLIAVHDSGRVINPMSCEGQVEGGLMQGLGYALTEEYAFQDGKLLNPNFTDYRVPTSLDVPDLKVLFVETEDPNGPYGAKSVGEMAMVPTAAAIANAIYDAVGVRLTELPMTSERVLKALKAKENLELG